jgi:glycosyltransferase involved in cell wall biosynthesis
VEALDSAENQSYQNTEIIIWDDASIDGTAEKIKTWITGSNKKCHFIQNKKNKGLCSSLNEAIKKSKGEYISFHSADDLLLPHKIDRQLSVLKELPPEYCLVYSKAHVIDSEGIKTNDTAGSDCKGINIFDMIFKVKFAIPTMATLIKKKCIEDVGCYDENLAMEDIDMWIRLCRKYKFYFDEVISGLNRNLGTSLSRSPDNFGSIANSIRMTRIKCLKMGWLNEEQKTIAISDLEHLVWNQYKRSEKVKKETLWLFITNAKMEYSKIIAIFILIGVKERWFSFIKDKIYNSKTFKSAGV